MLTQTHEICTFFDAVSCPIAFHMVKVFSCSIWSYITSGTSRPVSRAADGPLTTAAANPLLLLLLLLLKAVSAFSLSAASLLLESEVGGIKRKGPSSRLEDWVDQEASIWQKKMGVFNLNESRKPGRDKLKTIVPGNYTWNKPIAKWTPDLRRNLPWNFQTCFLPVWQKVPFDCTFGHFSVNSTV